MENKHLLPLNWSTSSESRKSITFNMASLHDINSDWVKGDLGSIWSCNKTMKVKSSEEDNNIPLQSLLFLYCSGKNNIFLFYLFYI